MSNLWHSILTRLRQKGRPCAMMLMLNILSTFWGGKGSLTTSLESARSSGWLSSGTCKVSFPQAALGIFFRAPDDEKRAIGQCRSIAKGHLLNHIPGGYWNAQRLPSDIVSKTNLVPSSNRHINAELAEPLHLPTHNLSLFWLAPFKISPGCEVTVAPKPGGAAAVKAWKEDGLWTSSVCPPLRQALQYLLSWPTGCWNVYQHSSSVAHMSRVLPHCGHSLSLFWSSQLSGLHHHWAWWLPDTWKLSPCSETAH